MTDTHAPHGSWELTHEQVQDISEIGLRAARAACRRAKAYSGSIQEDVAQEAWVWVLEHRDKVREYLASEEDGGMGRLYMSLYHLCLDKAQAFKAQQAGYRGSDLYYYSLSSLRNLLPLYFEEVRTGEQCVPDRDASLDLGNAMFQMRREDWNILVDVFDGDPDPGQAYHDLAVEWKVSDDVARRRVDRTLTRLQRKLGGERPSYHRKDIKSNAQARAQLDG